MTFFGRQISVFEAKISYDLFCHRPDFLDFPFFSQIFPIFAMLNVIFDPFLTRKTPFFTLFILSRASDNTTSLNIWGPMHGQSPHLRFFWGDRPPSPPPRSPPLNAVKDMNFGVKSSAAALNKFASAAIDHETVIDVIPKLTL